jgi:schlafen family protein
VDTGSIELDVLREQLADDARSAYVRAMFRRADSGWEIGFVWALIGTEPPGWKTDTWRYQQLAFASGVLPARELAALASPEPSAVLAVGGIEGRTSGARGPANWTRRPGFASHDRLPLPRPVTEYTLAPLDHDTQWRHDILAGSSCPSFPEPTSAWRAFFEGNFSLDATQHPPSHLAVLRSVDDAGWLGRIRVSPDELSAEVRGNQVEGCELELFGTASWSAQRLAGPGTVTFPLERGLPDNAWLWLKRDTHWLDYRVVDPRSAWAVEPGRAGVEFDLPVEPQANIEALLASGEGPQVEFKRQLPETAEQKRKVFKTIAAFATGDGGTVVFGMDPDELTVTGLDGEPRKLRDQLYDLVNRIVIPPPEVTVECHEAGGQTILILGVSPGTAPPYGIAVDKGSRDKPEFYVRRGASSYPAQPADLRQAARSRPAPDPVGQRTPFGPW